MSAKKEREVGPDLSEFYKTIAWTKEEMKNKLGIQSPGMADCLAMG